MCGRFVLNRTNTDLVSLFDVDVVGEELPGASWNIAPTQRIRVVIDTRPKASEDPEPVRRLEAARWGLVPGWARDPSGPPLFNARSEDIAQKRSFSTAVERRRAVVPASGYYEWSEVDGVKTPVFVSLPGDELMLFAGLYEWWKNPAMADGAADRWLLSASIITSPSTGPLAALHERMPVLLHQDLVEEWLDPDSEGSQDLVDEIVFGASEVAERALFHPVSDRVGTVANDDAELVLPLG